MRLIDAHSHICGDDELVRSMLEELNVQSYNICVAHAGNDWHAQRDNYRDIYNAHPERYQWMCTFDLPDFDNPDYVNGVIASLDESFADGAIACKIWKNIGMEHKAEDGSYMLVDHPVLEPIFNHIAKCNKTLLAHIGEPYACWQPIEFDSPHAGYYRQNPKWHMYGKNDMRSHAEHMEALDNVIERHPDLRIVGAHLGGLEYSLDAMGKRFDRFPNYAVDTGARNYDLAFLPRDEVIAFMERYQDRILFGIDQGIPPAIADEDEGEARAQRVERYRFQFLEAQSFYTSTDHMVMREKPVQGLGLPPEIYNKLFVTNAQHWYPVN